MCVGLQDVKITNGIVIIVTAGEAWCSIDGALTSKQLAGLVARAGKTLSEAEAELDVRASKLDGLAPGDFCNVVKQLRRAIETGEVS